MRKLVHRYLSDDSAATAIEYALIASMISIAIIGAVNALGSQLKVVLYDKIANALN